MEDRAIVRTQVSKRTRFEIFKRDLFACQYCGATPPAVTLEVDHIRPVSDGGINNQDNLVTACFDCNRGKGAIGLSSVPQSLMDKAADVAEREEQIRGYNEILEAKRQRIEDDVWRVAEVLKPGSMEDGFNRANLMSIKRFIETLGLHECLDAAEVARAKPLSDYYQFKYFCGICWGIIKGRPSAPPSSP